MRTPAFQDQVWRFLHEYDPEELTDHYKAMITREIEERRQEIPRHFRKATCTTPIPDEGVYLFGGVGTGKTYRAAAWANQCVDAGLRVAWIPTTHWLAAQRASFSGGEPPVTGEDVAGADLVILDDLGSEKTSAWSREAMYLLVDSLYCADVQVIATSNRRLGDLAGHLGERTASRIAQMCRPEQITGADRRLATARLRTEQ